MSKAVLVIDMPNNCVECDVTCLDRHQRDVGLIKHPCQEENYERPEWCPLRPLPEKKEPTRKPVSDEFSWKYTDYEKGFNDCIDVITGESKDGKERHNRFLERLTDIR